MSKLTIRDIAKMAKVSPATVSLVMNERKGISDATRARVKAILAETGFTPNVHTRRLMLRKSSTIHIVLRQRKTPSHNLFGFEVLMGIFSESRKVGYDVKCLTVDAANDYSQIMEAVHAGDSDGAIFVQAYNSSVCDLLTAENFPFICIDSHLRPDNKVPYMDEDHYTTAYNATKYLIQMGHNDIALITSEDSSEYFSRTFTGYTDALRDHELICRPEWIQKGADAEIPSPQCIRNLISCKHRPTAVFCAGDFLAMEAIKQIRLSGLRVPDDFSIIGNDDLLVTEYIDPPLTTMAFDKQNMGAEAVRTLFKIINHEPYEQGTKLPTHLVERGTVRKVN